MLADHIRPENLPQGNTVETPAPIPGRRPRGPVVVGKSGSALSDPSRKPSRVRAAGVATTEAAERAETGRRAPKKEGWAKAAPKFEHTKSFKPRARPDGEGGEGTERPKRTFKPREDQFIDKPRGGKAWSDKPRGEGRGGKPASKSLGKPGGKSGGRPGGGFGARPGGGTGGRPAGRPGPGRKG
jgi:23S rRNA pseudouridine2605 synthase